MKKIHCSFAVFIIIGVLSLCKAQKHDYLWVSGYGGTSGSTNFGGTDIDFKYWPPRVNSVDRTMDFFYNSASICDEEGNLLFYTNGCYINGNDHQPLLNGEGLNPGEIADIFCNDSDGYRPVQGSMFIPAPENSSLYYLFHLGMEWDDTIGGIGRKFYYTLLDKNLDNGRGDVVQKNQLILEDTFANGQITATRHANGRDWWIIVPKMASPKHYKLLFTPNGIEQINVQTIGSIDSDDNSRGNAAFSPNGNFYARFDYYNQLNLFQFDRCTGEFYDPLHWTISVPGDSIPLSGSAIFSPNSRYLYINYTWQILQYDLWAEDIKSSEQVVAEYEGGNVFFPPTFFIAQLGPDGRIYINASTGVQSFHLIESPNLSGAECNVNQSGFILETHNGSSMCFFPNYRLGPIDGSPCDSLGIDNMPLANFRWDIMDSLQPLEITFTDLSAYEPVQWHWDFGDNSTSSEVNPTHVFPAPGIYEVCLTVSNSNGDNTECYEVPVDVIVHTDSYTDNSPLHVYPIPFRDQLNIEMQSFTGEDYNIFIYNTSGKEIGTSYMQQSKFSWELDHLPPGVYFLKIISSNGKIYSKTILKM